MCITYTYIKYVIHNIFVGPQLTKKTKEIGTSPKEVHPVSKCQLFNSRVSLEVSGRSHDIERQQTASNDDGQSDDK